MDGALQMQIADAVARHSVHSRRVTDKKVTNGNHESVE
jgi:hypothetical protein